MASGGVDEWMNGYNLEIRALHAMSTLPNDERGGMDEASRLLPSPRGRDVDAERECGSMLSLARKGALLVCVLAALCRPGLGQHAVFQVYGQEQGLENLVVRGVGEDEQGFLWAATEAGLYRWDGTKFVHVGEEAGVTEEAIARLFRSSTGHLWVSSEKGLFYEDGGRFQQIDIGGRTPNLGSRGGIAELEDGEITFISGDRLISVRQSRNAQGRMEWVAKDFAQAHGGFPNSMRVNGLAKSPAGAWLGCDEGLCKGQGGSVTRLGEDKGSAEDSYNTLRALRSGEVWARGRSHLLRLAPGAIEWSEAPGEIGSGDLGCPFPFLSEDGQGRLLVNLRKKIGF